MFRLIKENLSLADLLLIAALLLLAVLSGAQAWKQQSQKRVFVYQGNLLIGDYPLTEDRTIRVDAHNTVRIQDGKVSMLEADCPDKRCVRQGASDMLPIICLPNKVVVEIKKNERERVHIVR